MTTPQNEVSTRSSLAVSAEQVPYVVGWETCRNCSGEGCDYCSHSGVDQYNPPARFIPTPSGAEYPVGERVEAFVECDGCEGDGWIHDDEDDGSYDCHDCMATGFCPVGFVVFGDPVPVVTTVSLTGTGMTPTGRTRSSSGVCRDPEGRNQPAGLLRRRTRVVVRR